MLELIAGFIDCHFILFSEYDLVELTQRYF